MREIRIGCSVWNHQDWRERVYPKGLPPRRWLEHYARLFDTVEVNNTFYRLPSRGGGPLGRGEPAWFLNNDWKRYAVRSGLWLKKGLDT